MLETNTYDVHADYDDHSVPDTDIISYETTDENISYITDIESYETTDENIPYITDKIGEVVDIQPAEVL